MTTARPLRYVLKGHTVVETSSGDGKGVQTALLDAAEGESFEVFIAADKNLRCQQDLMRRKIAIIVLGNAQRPALGRCVDRVALAVNAAQPCSYTELKIPSR